MPWTIFGMLRAATVSLDDESLARALIDADIASSLNHAHLELGAIEIASLFTCTESTSVW
jgi:hypothetical protein